MELSIIIPVFNVEAYLAKCLDSVLLQDIGADKFEVIIINDGSPDNSKAIALEYAGRHQNIIFIDQKNQGVAVARNAGLDRALGDYVVFIDSDDTIFPNSLGSIISRAYQLDVDVMYLSLDVIDEAGNVLYSAETCGDENVVTDGFTHARRTYLSTLYKRAAIGNTRFTAGIIRGEDTVFNVMVQAMAKRCSSYTVPYYKYLQRTDSARQFVGTDRNFTSSLLAIETINEFRKTHFPEPTAKQKAYFDNAIRIFVQRTLEWNVFPQKSKVNFDTLKARLRELGLGYMIAATARQFPMFGQSFGIFMIYRRLYGYYEALLHKFAKK